jgi:hypothetical protein
MLGARHAQATAYQRFAPMPFHSLRFWLSSLTLANLNPPAIHLHAGDGWNLARGTCATRGQRQRLIRRGRRFDFDDPLLAHALRPALDTLGGDFDFGERRQIFRGLRERSRLRTGVDDLLQQAR